MCKLFINRWSVGSSASLKHVKISHVYDSSLECYLMDEIKFAAVRSCPQFWRQRRDATNFPPNSSPDETALLTFLPLPEASVRLPKIKYGITITEILYRLNLLFKLAFLTYLNLEPSCRQQP